MSARSPGKLLSGHDGHGGMYLETDAGEQVGFVRGGRSQEANAAHLVVSWNTHDELVAALRRLAPLFEQLDIDEVPLTAENVEAVEVVRALIAKVAA